MNALTRFLGGSPVAVLLKLLMLSLLAGLVLVWLDLTPWGIVRNIEFFVRGVIARGFDSVHEIGRYVVTGAIIVVPIWLLGRILGSRRPRG